MTERRRELTPISSNQGQVILPPGRSLSSWNRIVRKGTNVSGVDQRRPVSSDELVQHNTRDDCWIAFNGKVYNCTPYMEYHPGGGDELMKSAGQDGTEIFNQVHRWVNLEKILGPCLIGPYMDHIVNESQTSGDHKRADIDMHSDTTGSSSPSPTQARTKPKRRKRKNLKTIKTDSDSDNL